MIIRFIISKLLILYCTVYLTACTYKSYQYRPQLTNIPLHPHTNEVDLYFADEHPKNKIYYEVLGLSAEGGAEYNALLLQLEDKAKKAGVDAVIHITNSQANYTSTEGNQYSTQIVKGIGIKYKDNVTYLDQYIKSKQVYSLSKVDSSSTQPALIYEAKFDMLGNELIPQQKLDPTYFKYVREFSFEYLLYDTWNWNYSTNEFNRVIKRKNYRGNASSQTHMTCYFGYKPLEGLKSIRTVYPTNPKKNVYIELQYAAKDRISEKQIYDTPRKKKLLYIEKLEYDIKNRIIKAILYKIENNNQIPFLQTDYTYYTIDDLPQPKFL